jgi:hypothetical protein
MPSGYDFLPEPSRLVMEYDPRTQDLRTAALSSSQNETTTGGV